MPASAPYCWKEKEGWGVGGGQLEIYWFKLYFQCSQKTKQLWSIFRMLIVYWLKLLNKNILSFSPITCPTRTKLIKHSFNSEVIFKKNIKPKFFHFEMRCCFLLAKHKNNLIKSASCNLVLSNVPFFLYTHGDWRVNSKIHVRHKTLRSVWSWGWL